MRRHALLLVAAAALTGACVPPRAAGTANAPNDAPRLQVPIHPISRFISQDYNWSYIVDPNTESCWLLVVGFQESTPVTVDCAKLARSVPPTAAAMTWMSTPPAPPAPPAAPLPPTAPSPQ